MNEFSIPDDYIDLDAHGTTALDPRVLDAMHPFLGAGGYGNASSVQHLRGERAAAAVEQARDRIAAAIGAAESRSIVFTSGATESINLALRGVAAAARTQPPHIVTWETEHRATLDPLKSLGRQGVSVTRLPVATDGHLDLETLRETLRPETALVSLLHSNNEIGLIHDVTAVCELCAGQGIPVHVDATQSLAWLPVEVEAWGAALVSFSAHKFHGPQGIGALYIRRTQPRARLLPQIEGGGQEHAMRAGTLNLAGIVGMGEAARLATAEREAAGARVRGLRDRLHELLCARPGGVHLNGDVSRRLPNNLNVSFDRVQSAALMLAVRGRLAISAGSACSARNPDPSHVLMALGMGRERALSSIRFGLSRMTTEQEIERAAVIVADAVEELRALAPPAGA